MLAAKFATPPLDWKFQQRKHTQMPRQRFLYMSGLTAKEKKLK
jgi:hypothetical protein